MLTPLTQKTLKIRYPADAPPLWKHLIDRWYQLDSTSYAVGEATFQLQEQLKENFDLLLLCSVGGSNQADIEYIESHYSSPAKFVYTLPNVALSAFCQVLEWQGKTRCVVCRENQLERVHMEASDIAHYEKKKVALFIVDQKSIGGYKQVHFFLYSKGIH